MSHEAVAKELNIQLTPDQLTQFDVAGQTPQSLAGNTLGSDILVRGMSPSDVCDMYGGTQFDFEQLKMEFKQICPDFDEALSWGTKSRSLQFGAEMLYKVGPESRRVKKSEGDKSWKFRFVTKNDNNVIIGTVVVSTFKSNAAPNEQPSVKNRVLSLTMKQASLIATHTLCSMITCMVEHDKILLTPLAGAIFCKDDIPKLMHEMGIPISSQNKSSTICAIISSCQSGGQYLAHSKCHYAVCAALCATRNMKDRRVAMDIVRKILKQYMSNRKMFDINKFRQVCKYATGGIPAEFEPTKLFAEMEEIQKLTRNNIRDIESTSEVGPRYSSSTLRSSDAGSSMYGSAILPSTSGATPKHK